jgi:transglutaminase superfamily protein
MGCFKFLRNKTRRMRELSAREWALLGASLFLLPVTAIGLRLLGLQRYQLSMMRWARPKHGTVGDSEIAATQAARMVAVAARYTLLGRTCLPRALVLSFLLQRMGLRSDLRIGVRQEGDELKAHAWIERHGQALNDTADVHERFAAFAGPICPVLGGAAQ